jgi:hypothetical protein
MTRCPARRHAGRRWPERSRAGGAWGLGHRVRAPRATPGWGRERRELSIVAIVSGKEGRRGREREGWQPRATRARVARGVLYTSRGRAGAAAVAWRAERTRSAQPSRPAALRRRPGRPRPRAGASRLHKAHTARWRAPVRKFLR